MLLEALVWLFTSLGFLALLEYSVHRWVQHRPSRLARAAWREHAIEHHGRGRNDINIEITWWRTVQGLLLFAVPLAFVSPLGCGILGLAFLSYTRLWTALHGAHHDLEGSGWVTRLPGYQSFRRHHLEHHRQPNRNFGAVFVFTDRLLGTRA